MTLGVSYVDNLVGQALFGDGADLDPATERPLPDSEGVIDGHLRESGLFFHLLEELPGIIAKNNERSLVEPFKPLGISDWNSIFWIVHPGGPAIVDQMEAKLGLEKEKMHATREVLREAVGRRGWEGDHGEGLEWGALLGFGPGLTVETVVLHSIPIAAH